MRFADIKDGLAKGKSPEWAIGTMLGLLIEQERNRESVPVRSPEPAGPTLAEQQVAVDELIRYRERHYGRDRQLDVLRAILASLERLALEGSHDKK